MKSANVVRVITGVTVFGLIAFAVIWFFSPIWSAEPQVCPVCGGTVVAVEKVKDDVSKPSRNLDVWNRSSCGNPLFGPGSTICPHDSYAYSAFLEKWGLSLEDPKGFALEMDGRIRDLPLPDKGKIRSLVVYSQRIDIDVVVHSVLFWCDTDQRYLDRLDEYAKHAGISLKIERERIPGQTYVKAEVETKRKQNGTPNGLEGTWTVVAGEQSGVPDKSDIGSHWAFTADKIVMEPSHYRTEFSYHIDTSKKPAEIDLKKLTDPNFPPGAWIGIYTMDKDVLRICAVPVTVEKPEMDWPRPTTFQTKQGDWRFLWVMKRAKTVSAER